MPTTGDNLERGGHDPRRLCSVSSTTSTSTYILPSQLPAGAGIYANSDPDDLEDDKRRFRKKKHQPQQQHRGRSDSGSSKNVRRWKVSELFSSPPRLIRRIKNVSDVGTSTTNDGHRKLAASRSADELLTVGRKPFEKLPNVAVQPRRQQRSRFSYIYGSVSDDDLDGAAAAGDASSKLGTLDQFIPVYEEFKSATARSSQRNSNHYVSIDELDDDRVDTKLYDVERSTTSVVYETAAPLPDDEPSTAAAEVPHHQLDVQLEDAELPSEDPSDSFPCPVCEELSSVSLEENDGGTCQFVAAMQELVVSQAVNARTCGNCSADDGRRAASSRCLDCRHDLCGPCRDAHATLRLRHRVVSIADLQTGRHQGEMSAALATPCRRHADRDGSSLCVDCDTVVCSECRRDGEPHADHRVTEQLDDVAARQRDFLDTLLDDASRRLNQLTDNGRLISEYREQFEADREDVIRAITAQVRHTASSFLFSE